jgi:4-alpha-glucanotransferase
MSFPRAAGILLHPTSLPSGGGIGDFGPAAYRFADFLASARQGIWQVLPLGPVGYGNSP